MDLPKGALRSAAKSKRFRASMHLAEDQFRVSLALSVVGEFLNQCQATAMRSAQMPVRAFAMHGWR